MIFQKGGPRRNAFSAK